MIARALANSARRFGAEAAVKARGQTVSYTQLLAMARGVADGSQAFAGRRVGVCVGPVSSLMAALAGLDAIGATAFVFHASANPAALRHLIEAQSVEALVCDRPVGGLGIEQFNVPSATQTEVAETDAAFGNTSGAGRVVLFTSGTSGPPKPALHTWESLAAGVREDDRYAGRRWLLTYDATRFAGIQVWLQSLCTGGQLSTTGHDPAETARVLVDDGIEYASGTPTFWRMLLVGAPREQLQQSKLVQITLGGEAADQPLLDVLRETFPQARITQIYASTEMGVCFRVNDGRAGFPASYLADRSLPCELRIGDGGELEIRSRQGMLGYLDAAGSQSDWFTTGDMVELRDNRVYFVGRKSDTINVGGSKVYPADVEQCILGVSGVEAVRVHAVRSSVTGQLVGAEVQAASGSDLPALRRSILEACRARLAKHQVPAAIEFVERVAVGESGKIARAQEAAHGA